MEPEERRLADEASTDFVVVPETASVDDALAPGAAWAVITDAESRPARLRSGRASWRNCRASSHWRPCGAGRSWSSPPGCQSAT